MWLYLLVEWKERERKHRKASWYKQESYFYFHTQNILKFKRTLLFIKHTLMNVYATVLLEGRIYNQITVHYTVYIILASI